MADLICPVGMKLISGDVANHPELGTVPPFCIDEYEVTNKQLDSYEEVHSLSDRSKAIKLYLGKRGRTSPQKLNAPNQPVFYANWYEAKAYCEAKGGSLPTGEQWEKAARGPKGYDYATQSGTLNHHEAQYDTDTSSPVGTYPPNGNGIYDMTGNMWEWTLEDYPLLGTKGLGTKSLRRGSLFSASPPRGLTVDYRLTTGNPATRGTNVGFRCVAPVLSETPKGQVEGAPKTP